MQGQFRLQLHRYNPYKTGFMILLVKSRKFEWDHEFSRNKVITTEIHCFFKIPEFVVKNEIELHQTV